MSGKATSIDIAYLAGVSQSTVSRALRGSPTVNEETRKRIEEIAHKLNYTVDKNASNLRTQHSNTIALLFFEDPTPDDSLINPFFLAMLGSITRACAQRGYDLLISFQELSGNWPTASSFWATATMWNTVLAWSNWSPRARISCAGERSWKDNPAFPSAATIFGVGSMRRNICWTTVAAASRFLAMPRTTIPNFSSATEDTQRRSSSRAHRH